MILREYHERAGLAAGFRVADDAARLEVAAELTGSARDGRRLLAEAAAEPAARELLVKALPRATWWTSTASSSCPRQLLAAEPDVARSLRDRWPLISVDEYQDIDAAQYRLLRLLAGDGRGLTVIGDPDQAIYGFRGADVGLFLRFGSDYPGAATRQLTRNYRSSRAIVGRGAAGHSPVLARPRPGPAAGRGRDARRARSAGQPRCAGDATRPRRRLIGFHEAADERAEAAWIAREIERLLGGASFHSLDTGRAAAHGHDGLGLSDIAVLYRTDAQAEPLGQALTRAGLPFQKSSHDLLERRTGVPEIVREMRLAEPAAPRPSADRLRRAVRTLAARAAGGLRRGGRGRARRGRGARPARPALRQRPGAVPHRDLARRRDRRPRPAGRRGDAAYPARRQGPGVRGGVPRRLREGPAAAVGARAGRR